IDGAENIVVRSDVGARPSDRTLRNDRFITFDAPSTVIELIGIEREELLVVLIGFIDPFVIARSAKLGSHDALRRCRELVRREAQREETLLIVLQDRAVMRERVVECALGRT